MKQAQPVAFPAQVPAALRPALAQLLEQLDQDRPDLLAGFYLIGSIALEAYEVGKSDVDFIAALRRELTFDEQIALARILSRATDDLDGIELDGSFWLDRDLPDALLRPALRYRYEEKQFTHAKSTFSPVDCWLLNRHPVVLRGRPWLEVGPDIAWSEVVEYMRSNLNSYWREFTYRPRRLAWLLTDEGVEWAVLGVARLAYALDQNKLPSKVQAGEYCFNKGPRWQQEVIREALAIREGKWLQLHSSVFRAFRARKFIAAVVRECG